MGFDISYHPIKEEEICEWYFDALQNHDVVEQLALQHQMEDFYKQKYADTLAVGRQTEPNAVFDKTHGYYIAVIQGFFRTYYYTRGSAFSFLIEEKPHFKKYTKNWQSILSFSMDNLVANLITENYSSDVYIPADQVIALLNDYYNNSHIKQDLDQFFSHKRIDVFLSALEASKKLGSGILEATEVVEPNPFDMPKSISYSNLFNCDKEGVYLYIDAAAEQMSQIQNTQTPQQQATSNKSSFWKKLFGK